MLLFLCWYSHSRLPKLLHLPVCTTSVWSLDLTLAPVNRHQKMINTVTANGNLSSSTNVNFVRKTLSLNEQCQLCKNNMEFERKNELCTNNEFEWTTTSLCKHQVWMNNVYFAGKTWSFWTKKSTLNKQQVWMNCVYFIQTTSSLNEQCLLCKTNVHTCPNNAEVLSPS